VGQDLSMDDRTVAKIAELMRGFSIEVTPRELDKIGALEDHLPAGTPVFITWLSNVGFEGTVLAAKRVAAAGMTPVPHLAARAVRSEQEIENIVGSVAVEAGVRRVLAIAGSVDVPAGPFPATIDLLRTGVLQRHGITWVGVAGHPEGSPDVGDAELVQAIVDKNAFAAESGLDVHLVTQFSFTPEPVVIWESSLREAGNRLPVHVGLPGAATAGTLVKFGLRCGVGPSLAVMRKRAGSVLKLATAKPQYPEATVAGVAEAALDGGTCFEAFHFFPFGAFERTATWASAIRDCRFTMPSSDRIHVAD
jgi:methylenetetrahydrofolate reductase (NADPH)